MAMTPIRHLIRKGAMGLITETPGVLPLNAREFATPEAKALFEELARDWRVLSFDIRQIESGIPEGATISANDLGDVRPPYPELWMEADGWAVIITQQEYGLLCAVFGGMPGERAAMLGIAAIPVGADGKPGQWRQSTFYDGEFIDYATWLALLAVSHINARTVNVHFRGSVLKERIPSAPHVPLALSSMPVVKLRPETKLFRESGRGSGEHLCVARRYHPVMAHQRKLSSGKTIRVRSHWRGDPEIGTVRPSYEVA